MAQHETVATSLADARTARTSAPPSPPSTPNSPAATPGTPAPASPSTPSTSPATPSPPTPSAPGATRRSPPSTHTPPTRRAFAAVLGLPDELAEPVYDRVRAKLEREPVEDLRIDFEDGYGPRPDAEEDAAAARAARLVAEAVADGTAPPYMGIRMKCMEAAVRDRGIRTLDIFLTGLMEAGGLPDGLVLTLPKVTYPEQVTAMVRLLRGVREGARAARPAASASRSRSRPASPSSAPTARATVARMIDAAEGRATGLHYGTFDYSACLRRQRRLPVHGPPGRRPRQGRHAGRRRGHRRTALRRLHQRAAGRPRPSRSTTPGGCTTAWSAASLARAYYQGWDMHPGHLPTRYAAVYAFYREGLEQAAARLAALRRPRPAATSWTSPPPPGPSAATCCAAWTAARWTPPRSRPPPGLTRADLDALAGRAPGAGV